MIKKTLTLLLIIACTFSSTGQITVESTQMMHDEKERPALKISLPVSVDNARDYFTDYMDETYDVKVDGDGFLAKKDILTIEEANIPSLHDKAMDIYVTFKVVDKENCMMKLIARDGYDLYFHQDYASNSLEKFNSMMRSYHTYATQTHFQALLEEQQEQLEDVVKSQTKAEESIVKNEKDIEKNLEENVKMKKENEELRNQITDEKRKVESLKKEIAKSKSMLTEVE